MNLKETLRLHALWLADDAEGVRADLTGANLRGVDLRGVVLRYAVLVGADLSDADLTGVDLTGVDMRYAILTRAVLTRAVLTGGNLTRAVLTGVNLTRAVLTGVNLTDAVLTDAVLPDFAVCPETGAFEAYKKVGHSTILRLLIPAHAARASSLVGRKCRASEARVLEVVSGDPEDLASQHDPAFTYRVGETMKPENGFSDDIRVECAPGIHFFMTRREAEEY